MLPAKAGSIFSKKYEKIVHVVKNWTKKRQDGGCNACVGGLGPFARGQTQCYPSESNKQKVTTHNDNTPGSHQGATSDHTFGSTGPRDAQFLKEKKEQERPMHKGDGTMYKQ